MLIVFEDQNQDFLPHKMKALSILAIVSHGNGALMCKNLELCVEAVDNKEPSDDNRAAR